MHDRNVENETVVFVNKISMQNNDTMQQIFYSSKKKEEGTSGAMAFRQKTHFYLISKAHIVGLLIYGIGMTFVTKINI